MTNTRNTGTVFSLDPIPLTAWPLSPEEFAERKAALAELEEMGHIAYLEELERRAEQDEVTDRYAYYDLSRHDF